MNLIERYLLHTLQGGLSAPAVYPTHGRIGAGGGGGEIVEGVMAGERIGLAEVMVDAAVVCRGVLGQGWLVLKVESI